jgi:hypothetical protein
MQETPRQVDCRTHWLQVPRRKLLGERLPDFDLDGPMHGFGLLTQLGFQILEGRCMEDCACKGRNFLR